MENRGWRMDRNREWKMEDRTAPPKGGVFTMNFEVQYFGGNTEKNY